MEDGDDLFDPFPELQPSLYPDDKGPVDNDGHISMPMRRDIEKMKPDFNQTWLQVVSTDDSTPETEHRFKLVNQAIETRTSQLGNTYSEFKKSKAIYEDNLDICNDDPELADNNPKFEKDYDKFKDDEIKLKQLLDELEQLNITKPSLHSNSSSKKAFKDLTSFLEKDQKEPENSKKRKFLETNIGSYLEKQNVLSKSNSDSGSNSDSDSDKTITP